MELIFHSDPGHGWLEVPITLAEELGITNQISSYSYTDGWNVFLEEDCDATLFDNAYKAKFNTFCDIVDVTTDEYSFIRELQRWK